MPLTRDVLLMFVPDEEIGGALGAEWMGKNHYAELDPEYVIIPAATILSMHGDAEFMPVDALAPAIRILFEALTDTASKR